MVCDYKLSTSKNYVRVFFTSELAGMITVNMILASIILTLLYESQMHMFCSFSYAFLSLVHTCLHSSMLAKLCTFTDKTRRTVQLGR